MCIDQGAVNGKPYMLWKLFGDVPRLDEPSKGLNLQHDN